RSEGRGVKSERAKTFIPPRYRFLSLLTPLHSLLANPPMPTALTHARVLTDEGWRDDLAVVLDGGRIAALLPPADPLLQDMPRQDLGGALLLPGFIDVQVNGGGGVLFNEAPTVATIRRIGAAHRRYGTTGFLPTLISDEPAVMRAALVAVEQALAE